MKGFVYSAIKWVLPIGLTVLAVVYSICRSGDVQYWDGAIGNWVATLLGIVTGVPVALYLERRRQDSEAAAKDKELSQIRSNTLLLLQGELSDAVSRVVSRMSMSNSIPIDPMKMSIWSALRDSGNLNHISEPNLISAIADAYRSIGVIADRERHIMNVIYGVNVTFPDGENAATKLLRESANFYPPALDEINKALGKIADSLK